MGFAFWKRVRQVTFQPAMSRHKHIPSDKGQSFHNQPFESLSNKSFPAESPLSVAGTDPRTEAEPVRKSRGRVDIVRQKAGRGGKTVTVVKNFVGIGLPEKEQLPKR
jgi:translation initiation factor 1